jgi:pSer/pThr/pTyr-binding forkhead associated (FHA) protein
MLQLKIGRSPSCDITINDIAVSREHAEIFHDDDGNTFLTDLNSSNGTFVNGKRLEGSTLLKFNDIVKIGNSLLPWRNYLKGEIPTSEVPDFNEVLNMTEFKDESKSEKENLNNASDKTKFRTASLIAVGGVLLSSVGLFLLFS